MLEVCTVNSTTTGHSCYPSTICVQGSPNVFVNSLAVCRVGDEFEQHCCNTLPYDCHVGKLSTGSPTYQANGLAVGRVGDSLDCGDTVATGISNYFVD